MRFLYPEVNIIIYIRSSPRSGMTRQATVTLGGFLRQDKRTLMDTAWQVG